MSVQDCREDRVRWIASQILPHEADLRAWLRRTLRDPGDIDDVIQEAYCRLSELPDHRHIRSGRAYLFATARSIVIHNARRQRSGAGEAAETAQIVEIVALPDEAPSPEQEVGARLQLRRVLDLIAALPPAYRHALEMRRLHGLSQKETALHLGVTEKVVENNALRGLRLLMKMMASGEDSPANRPPEARDEPALHVLPVHVLPSHVHH